MLENVNNDNLFDIYMELIDYCKLNKINQYDFLSEKKDIIKDFLKSDNVRIPNKEEEHVISIMNDLFDKIIINIEEKKDYNNIQNDLYLLHHLPGVLVKDEHMSLNILQHLEYDYAMEYIGYN